MAGDQSIGFGVMSKASSRLWNLGQTSRKIHAYYQSTSGSTRLYFISNMMIRAENF